MKNKLFISYAKEDWKIANKLYTDLKQLGLFPWLDKIEIQPGENWEIAIKDAIQNSKFFIALISKNSVNKIGFVQKELKIALDISDYYPLNNIFIIPLRLDESTPIDERLKKIQWVDLFKSYSDGLNDIIKVINPKLLNKAIPFHVKILNKFATKIAYNYLAKDNENVWYESRKLLDLRQLITKLNPYCVSCLSNSVKICLSKLHAQVDIDHLLYTLVENDSSQISYILKMFNIEIDIFKERLEMQMNTFIKAANVKPSFSNIFADILDSAYSLHFDILGQNKFEINSGMILVSTCINRNLKINKKHLVELFKPVDTQVIFQEYDNILNNCIG